jgi:hypothetical protein
MEPLGADPWYDSPVLRSDTIRRFTMRSMVIVILALALATAALAADQRTEQRTAAPLVMQPLPASPLHRGTCALGNLVDPVYNFGNWITGEDAYAYLVQPQADGCDCEVGVQIDRISMLMQFGSEDVPANFDVYVGLADAVWDDAAQVYRPGDLYCTSETWALAAPDAGLYEIYVDLEGACPCATADDAYFITFHLPNGFVWWPDALEDDTPEAGVSYYDGGQGWQDLVVDYGWWGNNIMRAEATCCSDPVATEGRSWSELKGLYR